MNEIALLQNYLLVGAALFALGLTGFLLRRNVVVMFLGAEMMLQGIALSLTAWGRFHGDWGGQLLAVLVITVAACEAGIALALVLMLCRDVGNLDIATWQGIREEGVRPFVDQELPEDTVEPHTWPTLTPSGRQPASKPQDEWYRSHV
jgi:NADH-quinone oxidoreductase subunit K